MQTRRYLQQRFALTTAVIRSSTSSALEVAPLAAEVVALEEAGPELPLVAMQRRLRLSASETHVLGFLAAITADARARAALVERFGNDRATTAVLAQLWYDGAPAQALRELSSHGTLRRLGLIERLDSPSAHEAHALWTIASRALAWLYDDRELSTELHGIARIAEARHALDDLAMVSDAADEVSRALAAPGAIVVACGRPGLGRRSLLVAGARERARRVLDIDVPRLVSEPSTHVTTLAAIVRECMLLDLDPLLRHLDEAKPEHQQVILDALCDALPGTILATCRERPALRCERPIFAIELVQPSSAELARLWRKPFSGCTDTDAAFLAQHYPLAPALIERAGRGAVALANGSEVESHHLETAVRGVLDDRLAAFARRLRVTQTWDDLVLQQEQLNHVAELAARIRRRATVYETWGFGSKIGKGLGVAALFSGPPGTGKTMLAGLIAQDLGLDVYVADTAKLVSKWIGETEKQLGELFDAAEASGAMILFDEADSLFGKRSDVKSSNDRYANLETNYLLQRLESFTGICILTSNHEGNIDPAFQRRLSLHLRLELPDPDERAKLWRAMLPSSAPVKSNIDFAGLGQRFEMSGGYIRNAALRAAFLAAEEGVPISQGHLKYAAVVEYESMGKIAC